MTYALAVFRSRQHTLEAERALRRAGIRAQAVTTPRALSIGCGLSVRFAREEADRAILICRSLRLASYTGVYACLSDGRRYRRLDG